MKTLLTIAGFDPSSGAGVTADLAVFAAHGFFGLAAITALTVQSTQGVRSVTPVAPELLADTLACLLDDIVPDGVKIGMLATQANVAAVAAAIQRLRTLRPGLPVVLDPVLQSSSGKPLLEPSGVVALRDVLLPLVDWVTPNTAELGILTGKTGPVEAKASALQKSYPRLSIAATGGDDDASDYILPAGSDGQWLRGEKIVSNATHGTGCAYSSALLCALARGDEPLAAATNAKSYVAQAIRLAEPIGRGKGPMNLLWPLRPLH